MPAISDLALYEVTVRRIDQSTGQEWAYPRLVSRASSVRGALGAALAAAVAVAYAAASIAWTWTDDS